MVSKFEKIFERYNKKNICIVVINAVCIIYGLLLLLNNTSILFRNTYILFVLVTLAIVIISEKDNLLRPISYLIISFVIFLWARPLISTFRQVAIISAGTGITNENIVETLVFLGITQNIVIIIAMICKPIYEKGIALINKERKFCFGKDVEIIVFSLAILFLLIFLVDSILKVPVILESDYLSISENILLEGYIYFKIGKLAMLTWIIFGKRENRFEIATALLLVASFGYLIRGSRGYFISYFFLWLIFYAKNHRVRIIPLCITAIGLLLLANTVLLYRMQWTSSIGVFDSIVNTLHSQGASIEPVFGSMHFTDQIADIFPKSELLLRYDFGNYIDQARGVVFENGGFGDSFFAELYFLGLPFALFFLAAISICVGFLEKCYFQAKLKGEFKNNFNLLLFMTMPNLVYFARGDIKDFIFKTIISYIFIFVLVNIKKKTTDISIVAFCKSFKK